MSDLRIEEDNIPAPLHSENSAVDTPVFEIAVPAEIVAVNHEAETISNPPQSQRNSLNQKVDNINVSEDKAWTRPTKEIIDIWKAGVEALIHKQGPKWVEFFRIVEFIRLEFLKISADKHVSDGDMERYFEAMYPAKEITAINVANKIGLETYYKFNLCSLVITVPEKVLIPKTLKSDRLLFECLVGSYFGNFLAKFLPLLDSSKTGVNGEIIEPSKSKEITQTTDSSNSEANKPNKAKKIKRLDSATQKKLFRFITQESFLFYKNEADDKFKNMLLHQIQNIIDNISFNFWRSPIYFFLYMVSEPFRLLTQEKIAALNKLKLELSEMTVKTVMLERIKDEALGGSVCAPRIKGPFYKAKKNVLSPRSTIYAKPLEFFGAHAQTKTSQRLLKIPGIMSKQEYKLFFKPYYQRLYDEEAYDTWKATHAKMN